MSEHRNAAQRREERNEPGTEQSGSVVDLREVQRAVMDNKRRQGFNLTDVPLELCLLSGEVAELFDAWRKRTDTIGEELADVALYVCGLAGILGVDLAEEVTRKLAVNAARRYERRADGVLVRVEDPGAR